ncbi:Leucine-rich PPR motif-containing protein [Dirofilaria immitis]
MFARISVTKTVYKKQITEAIRKGTAASAIRDVDKVVGPSTLITNPLTSYDSKWSLDSLDKLQHSQMSYLELSLFKKHFKRLQVDQQKNIYDVIDSIEWNYLVTEAHLDKALHILNDLKYSVKNLADSEIATLINATGCRCQMLSAVQRNEYTDRLLLILKMRGVVLGVAARNALLAAQIDNQVDVDVMETLKQFESDGLVPDAQTYGQLSRIYAQKNNLKGIVKIVNHVRNIGIQLPNQILESMVYGLASLGQDKKANLIIEYVTENNISMIDSLKMAYVLAKAEHFNDQNILEFLDKIENADTFIEKCQISIYELLFSLAKKGKLEAIIKLKTILSSSSEDLSRQWGPIIYSRIRRFLSKEEENIAAAALLLDLIPDSEKRSRLQSILIKRFSSVIQKKQVAEAVRMCIVFQKCNILKHPLRLYLHDVALNNPKDFHNLFSIYKRTDDFVELQSRSHLQLPVAVQHFSELLKAETVEKKVEHLSEIARTLRSTGIASCGDRYFGNVKDLLIIPLLKDMNVLRKLMREVENDSLLQCFIVDVLVTHLLATKQMHQLQLLLHGALKNSSAGESYPYQEVRNLILNTSVSNKTLIPACHLLRLLFPLPGASNNHQYGKGMQIIKAAIVASDLNKVKMMCELWSADKRIVLRKNDKEDLLQTLDWDGELSKKESVTILLEKESFLDTKVQRTKHCTDEKINVLSKVAASGAVKQKLSESREGVNRKCIESELRDALDCGDLEKAKEIWVTGSKHISASLGLLLAEKLYFLKMMDHFKSVLLKLSELYDDLSHHVLTAYDSSDASNRRITFLNEVSKILHLNLSIKEELLYSTRINAFHELIEKGNLSQALDLLKIISAQKNSVFGQFDLMGAAIERDDIEVISGVLDLIATYHGKESSLADFCVVLLERYKKAHAMRLVQSNSFRISGTKLSYYIDREINLNRVEVIFDLFEFCIAKSILEQRDLENAVSKILTFYAKRKNNAMINLIDEKLKSICIRLTPKMNSLLLKSKGQNFEIVVDENASMP